MDMDCASSVGERREEITKMRLLVVDMLPIQKLDAERTERSTHAIRNTIVSELNAISLDIQSDKSTIDEHTGYGYMA